MNASAPIMDIRQILSLLPHRYPFLLVDRVESCEPGVSIHAYKNVTVNEPFFQGHFPGLPVMPGVLILEALAQAGGLMICAKAREQGDVNLNDKVFLFAGIEKARFRRPVMPGDRLDLHCELVRKKMKLCKMNGYARVAGSIVAEAELSAVIVDREEV